MSKPVIRTPWKKASEKERFEKISDLPSLTIPDDSMSVREIMQRHTRGLPIRGQKVPIYEDDQILPDNFHKWDLADQQTFRENAAQELEDIKQKIEEQKKKKAEKQKSQNKKNEHEDAHVIDDTTNPTNQSNHDNVNPQPK